MKLALSVILISLSMNSCKTTSQQSELKVIGGSASKVDTLSGIIKIGSCSAVKISQTSYLSAKHCVDSNGWRLGETVGGALVYKDDVRITFEASITKIESHPEEDLAVMVLDQGIPEMRPIPIYRGEEPSEVVLAGYGCTQFIVSGFSTFPGSSPGYLQEAKATLWDPQRRVGHDTGKRYYVKAEAEEFLGEKNIQGPALCPGDSGGGLLVGSHENGFSVVAIIVASTPTL